MTFLIPVFAVLYGVAFLAKEGGQTIVPLSIYFKDGYAKVEIALAKGKREYDKRHTLRAKQDEREAQRAISTRRER